jgi:hypothetical protein
MPHSGDRIIPETVFVRHEHTPVETGTTHDLMRSSWHKYRTAGKGTELWRFWGWVTYTGTNGSGRVTAPLGATRFWLTLAGGDPVGSREALEHLPHLGLTGHLWERTPLSDPTDIRSPNTRSGVPDPAHPMEYPT